MAPVKVSAKSDYAVRALLELAQAGDGPVKGEQLAQSQDIPLRAGSATLHHPGREVRGNHTRALARAGDGEVAVTRSHVEHLLAGGHRAGIGERLRRRPQRLGEIGVIAEPPHPTIALLDCIYVHGASVSSEWRR